MRSTALAYDLAPLRRFAIIAGFLAPKKANPSDQRSVIDTVGHAT